MSGIAFAAAVLGSIELDRLSSVAPVWRPLLRALAEVTSLRWRNPGTRDTEWFPGEVIEEPCGERTSIEKSSHAPTLHRNGRGASMGAGANGIRSRLALRNRDRGGLHRSVG